MFIANSLLSNVGSVNSINDVSQAFSLHGSNSIEFDSSDYVVYCENDKLIIKISRALNGSYTYTSWVKPKTIEDSPSLVLIDGRAELQGTSGGCHYIFKTHGWTYIVEENLMAETLEFTGTFLKVYKDGDISVYEKMRDLRNPNRYDRPSYEYRDLIGVWWTPHAAIRKLYMYADKTFVLEIGDGTKLRGDFILSNGDVILNFYNNSTKVLKIGGGTMNMNITLKGEGENFIKS